MTERLADVVAQIHNVRQLGAVVTAMRGIAASRAQQGRALLAGIRAYAEVVSTAIGQALHLQATDRVATGQLRAGRPGLILMCAEQGFAGAFSERILDAVRDDLAGSTIFLAGTRGAMIAGERGIRPAWSEQLPTHIGAIPSFANRLADALYRLVAAETVAAVDIVFARSSARGVVDIHRHSLLPFDLTRLARPHGDVRVLTTLAPGVLLERLISEYVYAQLCEAAMHAFVAENEARVAAMSSARSSIEEKLIALSQRERHVRQEEITTEVVELAAGAVALDR
jgi:F-type H+-transporting ATPase subunit gamma